MKIPINIVTGQLKAEEVIVGIDLGTTNSLVAYINRSDNKPVTIADSSGDAIVPSVIYFNEQNEAVVGREAKSHLISDASRTIYSVKRLLGKNFGDLSEIQSHLSYRILDDQTEGPVKVVCGNKYYSPIELSALILKELKERASHFLRTEITKAVITVPAYFNDSQRQATRDAGKLAGLEVLRILNEPTAASLAYGIENQVTRKKTIAVYDLGGGTFDISILNIENGIYEVLSTHGDTFLGGDDFDRAIVDHWIREGQALDLSPEILRVAAEQAKKILSNSDEAAIEPLPGIRLTLDLKTFESLVVPILQKTMDCCALAVKDSGLDAGAISRVVMVGGSTRTPLVKKTVATFFSASIIHDEINPDEVVALGAALQADVLSGHRKDLLLLDVTPLSLGIETMGGLMDVLIPRNTRIPAGAGRQYTTSKDGQTALRITVYQGERDLVAENRKLGSFDLKGIPAMPAGLPKVEIKFRLNADGILRVSATELRSGVQQEVEVRPQYGLTDAEVEQMLMDSFQHAQSDVNARMLIEAATEADQLLYTTEKFLENHRDGLSDLESQQTQEALNRLKAVIKGSDRQAILAATEKLNEVTRPFAERLMDRAIAEAMKGKKI